VLQNQKWVHTANGRGGWYEPWQPSKVTGYGLDSQVENTEESLDI
jgi:hypothetical protein